MRKNTDEDYLTALSHIDASRRDERNVDVRRKLAVLELLCHHFRGDNKSARMAFEKAHFAGELGPDLLLAAANLEQSPSQRLEFINRVLAWHNLSPVALLPDDGRPAYDRLTSAVALPKVTDGPKVTVIIAAYEAAETLTTSLRSLQEQTWQNLEILVMDDCSPSPDTARVTEQFAASDPRIRLIRMEQNGGAYVARNRGLDEATGSYVTLHDADDWSHPQKIEDQIRFMEENPDVMGCTTQQARATVDFAFTRFPHNGEVIRVNVSSFLWRGRLIDELGGWATTRFAADSELIFRIKKLHGAESIVNLKTGPYSFQRVSETSAVKDDRFGIDGFYYGVRHEFFSASSQYITAEKNCRFDRVRNNIPYPVPNPMHPDRVNPNTALEYDVIIASDFRMPGGSIQSCLEEIKAHHAAGLRTALISLYRYDLDYTDIRKTTPEFRKVIQELKIPFISYGEIARCKLLILRYPPVLEHHQRYLPSVEADQIRVIVNQPPMSDYGPDGVRRYHLENCAKNIREYFGKDAIWHPIGPLVRDALYEHHESELHQINLSDADWSNIIDTEGWSRGPRADRSKNAIRIGRHSRDNAHKWPATTDDILAAYPDAPDVEIHVLGGAESVRKIIGQIPSNWTVHDFGAMPPREFLKDLDFWIYFSHPDWLESFGRTIIEAMAVGVPVILPEIYRPLFEDAALYATPQTAVSIARNLHEDAAAYDAHVRHAQEFVRRKFSYEMHLERINGQAGLDECSGNKIFLKAPHPTQSAVTADAGKVERSDTDVAEDVSDNVPSIKIPSIPGHSGKASASSLTGFPTIDLNAEERLSIADNALLKCRFSGHRFDYLWRPKADAKRLFVLFAGNAHRSRSEPPVFQRWSWAKHFPGHCLYVSDPMLHMAPNLGLAWYAGTETLDPMEVIIRRIRAMLPLVGLTDNDVTAYGSSGGGFAALRMASMMPDASAIAINPQTNIAKYQASFSDRFARICLKRPNRYAALADFPRRMDLTLHNAQLRQRKIILIQNRVDEHHYTEHFSPFCSAMGATPDENLTQGNFRRILFDHEGGHAKAETPEVFATAMQIIQSDFSITSRIRT